jgi:ribonuclease HII
VREQPPLAELAGRAASLRDPSALARLARELRADSRAGAQALAERCSRRARGLLREQRRQRKLFALRRRLQAEGSVRVAGVDEVGVGPLAGPVVAAAVVLRERPRLPGLDDSKRMTRAARERLAPEILAQALAWSVAEVWPEEIDRLNIHRATQAAMRRAIGGLAPAADYVLVDGRRIPELPLPQTALVGGDARDGSIAAASVVAKVHRDALMVELDARFPGYGFAEHKGYATRAHLYALQRRGPTPLHRRSFAPVSQLSLL